MILTEDEPLTCCLSICTPVQNSCGIPHILEHMTILASPGAPDLILAARSNPDIGVFDARTYPDRTNYLFTAKNFLQFGKFFKLLTEAIYLPSHSQMAFDQEGWHHHFDSLSGKKEVRGIVYNEMLAAAGTPTKYIARRAMLQMFPLGTYGYAAAGLPEEILKTDLEQIRDYHSRHYLPSNTILVVSCPRRMEKHLQALIGESLDSTGAITQSSQKVSLDLNISPTKTAVLQTFAPDLHIALNTWNFGRSGHGRTNLLSHLIYRLMLQSERSPMRQMIEKNSKSVTFEFISRNLPWTIVGFGVKAATEKAVQHSQTLIDRVVNDLGGLQWSEAEALSHLDDLIAEEQQMLLRYGSLFVAKSICSSLTYGDPISDNLNLAQHRADLESLVSDSQILRSIVADVLASGQQLSDTDIETAVFHNPTKQLLRFVTIDTLRFNSLGTVMRDANVQ